MRAAAMSALLTDLYQLTMLDAYVAQGMQETAVFELFVRKLPPGRNFLVAAGLEQALDYLTALSFDEEDIAWLSAHAGLHPAVRDTLRRFRFTGDVDALPEGTPFFADEPVLRVSAPLPQAQIVESRLLNLIHFQTLIASKAARVVHAAQGRVVVDFGMRRAHGADAALYAARAAYATGFTGTATVEAGRRFAIPVFGTMAHSFIQAHDSERAAFEAFLRARPVAPTLLVDTYDTEAAVAKVIELAHRVAPEGLHVAGVRLDSGDLGVHARAVRALLDAAGLPGVTILASGNLDEWRIARLLAEGAPIDGFGVGTSLVTSSDAPSLDAVYKLQVHAGRPTRKRSEGKATWPGVKQVCRQLDASGLMARDVVQLESETPTGVTLLRPAMRAGRRVGAPASLDDIRRHHAAAVAVLPPALRALEPAVAAYPVEISAALRELARRFDARPV